MMPVPASRWEPGGHRPPPTRGSPRQTGWGSTAPRGPGHPRSIVSSTGTSGNSAWSRTSASRRLPATGVQLSPRSSTSSSPVGSWSTASPGSGATPAPTSICSRSPVIARYFCPSCHAKRLARWSLWLDQTLLAPVPHRQVVLTLPKRLRACCLYRRSLLGDLARVAARIVTAAVRATTGGSDLKVGIVDCLQTHGSLANWHPHLHLVVTDGRFQPDGTFVRWLGWPSHDTLPLTEAFRRAVCSGSSRAAACSPGGLGRTKDTNRQAHLSVARRSWGLRGVSVQRHGGSEDPWLCDPRL
jgi:hypothetical protein